MADNNITYIQKTIEEIIVDKKDMKKEIEGLKSKLTELEKNTALQQQQLNFISNQLVEIVSTLKDLQDRLPSKKETQVQMFVIGAIISTIIGIILKLIFKT